MYKQLAFWALLFPILAFGWGHNSLLKSSFYKATLIDDVLNENLITYCIQIDDPFFNKKSIKTQLVSALKLWIQAAELNEIEIYEESCSDQKFDLKLWIGEEKTYSKLGAYQIYKQKNNHFYSLIKINTNYRWKTHRYQDLAKIFPDHNLTDLIQEISFDTTIDLAKRYELNQYKVRFNSYSSIIHELGHSFGLCDTYSPEVTRCDPNFKTKIQPRSVMRDSGSFYLYEDDIEGIRSIFKRFQ